MCQNSGSAGYFLKDFSHFLQLRVQTWQEIILAGPQMVLGTIGGVVEELFSERAGCCPLGPGRSSGEPEACWVYCGLRLEGGVSRLFTLTGSASSYSHDCINIC